MFISSFLKPTFFSISGIIKSFTILIFSSNSYPANLTIVNLSLRIGFIKLISLYEKKKIDLEKSISTPEKYLS